MHVVEYGNHYRRSCWSTHACMHAVSCCQILVLVGTTGRTGLGGDVMCERVRVRYVGVEGLGLEFVKLSGTYRR